MADLADDRRLSPLKSVYSQTLAIEGSFVSRRRSSFAGYITHEHRMLQASFDGIEPLGSKIGLHLESHNCDCGDLVGNWTRGSDSCATIEDCSEGKAFIHQDVVGASARSDIPKVQKDSIESAEEISAATAARAAFLKRQVARKSRQVELAVDTTEVLNGDKCVELPRLLGRASMRMERMDASILEKPIEVRVGDHEESLGHGERTVKESEDFAGTDELERSVHDAELPRLLGRISTTTSLVDTANNPTKPMDVRIADPAGPLAHVECTLKHGEHSCVTAIQGARDASSDLQRNDDGVEQQLVNQASTSSGALDTSIHENSVEVCAVAAEPLARAEYETDDCECLAALAAAQAARAAFLKRQQCRARRVV
eukprot:TRINITY_DN20038_c0_g1_i1.p1 TRINITY_DN20038_c0_g1~~TRINITY_DN20038_c0_g1_i1.p1  ORF type:complete len:395 (+),score=68.60 TRINITY_DN20038_c0_g1_i1:78-1187(+)